MNIDITGKEFAQNPYKFYQEMRKTGNVHYLKNTNSWLVIGYKEIQECLVDIDSFTSEGENSFDPILLNCDPPKHTKHRKVIATENGIFSNTRINTMEDQHRQICRNLLDQLSDKPSFDLMADFAIPFSSLVILNLLGISPTSTNELKEWSQGVVLNSSLYDADFAKKNWNKIKPHIEEWIESARNAESKFGIAELLLNPEADFLTTASLLNLVKILLLGGNETTPNLVASGMLILLKNPSLKNKLISSPHLIPNFINEVLRLEAPTQIIQRTTKKEVVVNNIIIPANSTVGFAIGAANRDPEYFEYPDVFDMDIKRSKIYSFGYGPHYCLGAHLAKQEAQIAFEELLNRFPKLCLSNQYELEYKQSSHIRGLEQLYLYKEETLIEKIEDKRNQAIEILSNSLKEYRHFISLENYPRLNAEDWIYTHPSPFIHANVMYSLLQSKNSKINSLINAGKLFLIQQKELNDTWRFWKSDICRNPVPPDIDDISICSFILEALGEHLRNKELFYHNIKPDGSILTWIFPSVSLLWVAPKLTINLYKNQKLIAPTVNGKMLNENDSELGVITNALLYLGENEKTKSVIKFCINSWKEKSYNKNFYDNDLIIAFHIARAYKEKIKSFEELKEDISEYVKCYNYKKYNAETLIAYLTAKYIGDEMLAGKIKNEILKQLTENTLKLEPFRYFTSKNREFYGGSVCLTAALFIEATENW
jgi:cytochrome P450